VEELFAAAQELPRENWNDHVRSSTSDAAVAAEVLSLLGAGADTAPLDLGLAIGRVAASLQQESRSAGDLRPGHLLGVYRIERLLGRGGMGAVYLAHSEGKEYTQRVAIKVISGGVGTNAHTLERFRQERLILARLEHPYIARMLDGGAADDGQQYLAMEFVDGKPLNEYAKDLPIRQRLELFVKVCSAVAYAHRELVVHRDLKPGNILVTADGTPKLLDFGIGKLLSSGDRLDGLTREFPGVRMLTLEYASPEQVLDEAVGAGADIYALGAILYEILSGAKAHRFPDLSPSSVREVICEQPATKPSTAAARRNPDDSKLRKTLAGDLDNIVLKAMSKDRQRRYETAQALADDILRYLNGYPVLARPDSAGYRLQKFALRNRLGILAAALLAVTLASAMVITIREKRQAERRFQQVRGLANRFLVDVDREMRKTPGTTRAREVMVRTALTSLDGLAKEAGEDPGILMDLAEAYEKAAQVQGVPGYQNLGQVDAALASQSKSVELFRHLMRVNATSARDPLVRRRYSDQLSNYGRVLMLEGDLEGARRILEEGLALVDNATNPDDAIVASYNITHLGRILTMQGKHEESERLIRRGLAMLAPYGERPSAARYQLESDLADDLRLNGFPEQSEEIQARLIEIRRRNHRGQPRDTIRMRRLGEALHALGLLYAGGREPGFARPDKAIALLEESRTMFEKMRDADSNNMSGPVELAVADIELARILPPGKRSLELLDEASHLLEETPVRSALIPGLRAQALALRAAPLRALGRMADAESALTRAASPSLGGGEDWLEHLVAAGRWREAAAAGEALLLAPADRGGDLLEALRQSWILVRLQTAYSRLGLTDRAAPHQRRRKQLWLDWAAKRPGNAQILAELAAAAPP
jgi:serine/threonine protein kinase